MFKQINIKIKKIDKYFYRNYYIILTINTYIFINFYNILNNIMDIPNKSDNDTKTVNEHEPVYFRIGSYYKEILNKRSGHSDYDYFSKADC